MKGHEPSPESARRNTTVRLEIEGDCVVFCSETFNHLASTFKAVWPISTDWGPEVAGGSATIGSGKHRNSQNPLFKLQYQLPRQLFGTAHRRGRLVSVLAVDADHGLRGLGDALRGCETWSCGPRFNRERGAFRERQAPEPRG
eukprot:g16209.t1